MSASYDAAVSSDEESAKPATAVRPAKGDAKGAAAWKGRKEKEEAPQRSVPPQLGPSSSYDEAIDFVASSMASSRSGNVYDEDPDVQDEEVDGAHLHPSPFVPSSVSSTDVFGGPFTTESLLLNLEIDGNFRGPSSGLSSYRDISYCSYCDSNRSTSTRLYQSFSHFFLTFPA